MFYAPPLEWGELF